MGAVRVRIVNHRGRSVQSGQMKLITHVASSSREERLEESFTTAVAPQETVDPLFPAGRRQPPSTSGRKTRTARSSPTRCGPKIRNGSECAPATSLSISSAGKPVTSKELIAAPILEPPSKKVVSRFSHQSRRSESVPWRTSRRPAVAGNGPADAGSTQTKAVFPNRSNQSRSGAF